MDPIEYLNQEKIKYNPQGFIDAGYTKEGYYFWDEIWISCYGPYDTELAARDELKKYAQMLDYSYYKSLFRKDL